MIDFTKSIFENRKIKGAPLLVAHRGVCGANVPCNSIAAYKIALNQGADVVEIDVSKSKDGKFYVFHPGMEHVFLKSEHLSTLTSQEIDELRLLNQDSVPTSYKVPTLEEVTVAVGCGYCIFGNFGVTGNTCYGLYLNAAKVCKAY